MLTGNNGILQKATDAKQASERAEAKEQAQIDIMAWIAEKTSNHQDASLDDNKVKDILTDKSYVKEAKISSFITAKGEYEIPYSDLYELTKNHSSSDTSLSLGTVNEEYKTKFGYLVTGYNSTSGSNWRLFYADSNNAYLISDGLGNTHIDNLSWFGTSEISDLGKELNKKFTENSSWEQKTDEINLDESIKAIASLLDTTKWLDYKTEYANWAIGAPTLEMFIKSYNATHQTQLNCKVEKNATGYLVGKNTSGEVVSNYDSSIGGFEASGTGMEAAIYYRDYEYTGYLLGSPSHPYCGIYGLYYSLDDDEGYLCSVGFGGPTEMRPIASVPISKIKDGTITITNKYFN